MKKLLSVLGFLILAGAFVDSAQAQKKEIVEHYTGVVVATGGSFGGRTMRIDVRIRDYTSDEEVTDLLRILKEDGQDALRRNLEKLNKGNISPSVSTGNDLAVVRAFDVEGGRLIRVITARTMPFLELYYGGRSTDYPFAIVELRVDAEGKGEGSIIGGAKFKFNKDNELEIESYGHQYLKLTNVSRYK